MLKRSAYDRNVPNDKNQRPEKLHCDWDTVGARIIPILRSVVDNGCQEQTDGDGKLIRADNSTSDPLWRSLRLVHGNYVIVSYAKHSMSLLIYMRLSESG